MKKLLLLLVLAALAVGGYWVSQRQPRFRGKFAYLHENLWRFSRSKDPAVRYQLAALIYLAPINAQLQSLYQEMEESLASLTSIASSMEKGEQNRGLRCRPPELRQRLK
jgi:hypothetical protein